MAHFIKIAHGFLNLSEVELVARRPEGLRLTMASGESYDVNSEPDVDRVMGAIEQLPAPGAARPPGTPFDPDTRFPPPPRRPKENAD